MYQELKSKQQELENIQIEFERQKSQVKDLQATIDDFNSQNNASTDQKLYLQSVIDKKEESIVKLHEEIMKLRDDVRSKDNELEALSQKMIDKGNKN